LFAQRIARNHGIVHKKRPLLVREETSKGVCGSLARRKSMVECETYFGLTEGHIVRQHDASGRHGCGRRCEEFLDRAAA
jgi:hypothetical protein